MSYTCHTCDVIMNSESNMRQHCLGVKHKRRLSNPKNKDKIQQIKAAGLNYFVSDGSSSNDDQSQQTSTVAEEEQNTPEYCNCCRLVLTSPSIAEKHYAGSKHWQRIQMLKRVEIETNGNPSLKPKLFCAVCRILMTSEHQLEIHFNGNKHKQTLKMLQEKDTPSEGGDSQVPSQEDEDIDEEEISLYCQLCQLKFTSKGQARMHYRGGKHRSGLRVLEEKKAMTEGNMQDDGEPPAKRHKFVLFCEVCNVKLHCPSAATAHYEGGRHAKTVQLLKSTGQEELAARAAIQEQAYLNAKLPQKKAPSNARPPPFQDSPSQGTPSNNGRNPTYRESVRNTIEGLSTLALLAAAVEGGGHLYCYYCNIVVCSTIDMEQHKAGIKHRLRMQQINNPVPKGGLLAGLNLNFKSQTDPDKEKDTEKDKDKDSSSSSQGSFPNPKQEPFGSDDMEPFRGDGMEPFRGDGMGPFRGDGMGPFRGDGMGPFRGDGMGPFRGDGMGPFRGDGMGPFRGDGMGPFRGDGMGPFRGDGMGPFRGDGMGAFRGDGMGPFRGDGMGPFRGDGMGPFRDDGMLPTPRKRPGMFGRGFRPMGRYSEDNTPYSFSNNLL